jgi:hypothetical protein
MRYDYMLDELSEEDKPFEKESDIHTWFRILTCEGNVQL